MPDGVIRNRFIEVFTVLILNIFEYFLLEIIVHIMTPRPSANLKSQENL